MPNFFLNTQNHNKKPAPSYIVTGSGNIVIHAALDGEYYLDAKVNGAIVHFMIDTGATEIVLAPFDAAHAGISPGTLHYIRSFSSANGKGAGANVTLDTISVGPLQLKHMDAIVNKTDMEDSLLGMSFLRRLKAFNLQGNILTLVP